MTTSRQTGKAHLFERVGSLLANLFPNLATMDGVKWMGIPIAILLLFGIIMGVSDLLFGSRVID